MTAIAPVSDRIYMSEEITEEEAFENNLREFLRGLESLQLDPVELCESWGNYNVAGELIHFFRFDGGEIISKKCSYLDANQKQQVNNFLESLDNIPDSVIYACDTAEGNQKAMQNPCWETYRESAKLLIKILESASIRNKEYFLKL